MKIALLSDIHANSDALLSVLNEAKSESVASLIITGDFVDYYYNAKQVFALLSEWDYVAISGNHEEILLNWKNNKYREFIKNRFGSGIKTAYETLSKERIKWLTTLPERKEVVIDNKKVLLCHGSPWNRDEYIYPNCTDKIKEKLFSQNYDLITYGHTHYPALHKYNNQIVVNPGSVGQPRDRKSGACWALWDTKTHTVSLKRTNYNTDAVIAQCKANDPNLEYLWQVLKIVS